jgi:cell wall-associated NlpC family hydrolase
MPKALTLHRFALPTLRVSLWMLGLLAGSLLLLQAATPALAEEKPASSEPSKGDAKGTRYRVANTDGTALRVHDKPGVDTKVIGRLAEGTLVTLEDAALTQKDDERWVEVKSDKLVGWVAARYLSRNVTLASMIPNLPALPADAPLAKRVVAVAGAMVGQPYVFGGSKPGGFDCSGFVHWVYTQAGKPLPRLIPQQLAAGKPVERKALEVGDLVAFEDTYTSGVSHVGIFIGADQFIHAADELQGVRISSMSAAYWSSHYHSAARISGT